jgi:hypothetical protein
MYIDTKAFVCFPLKLTEAISGNSWLVSRHSYGKHIVDSDFGGFDAGSLVQAETA